MNIINRFMIKDIKPPLGRWNINYCDKTINKKIDFANQDNCYSFNEISKKYENNYLSVVKKNT